MNETDPIQPRTDRGPHDFATTAALAPRRGPDLLTLVTGLGALGIAGTALLNGIPWLPHLEGRWVLVTLALIVGLLLVIGSLRLPRRS
jgi:hypothetical protein